MAAEFQMVTSHQRPMRHSGTRPEKVWGDVRHVHVGCFEPRDERTPSQRTWDRTAVHRSSSLFEEKRFHSLGGGRP